MILYCENKWAKIYHGDCLEGMKSLSPVNLILFDPPFGEPGQILEWINISREVIVPGGAVAHFAPVWDLKNVLNRMTKWYSLVSILCLERTGRTWTPLIVTVNEQRPVVKFTSYRTDGGPTPLSERVLNTQRPPGLMRWIVRNYTRPGDVVLDPFMGSGILGLACKVLRRRYIGIDIYDKHCEIAKVLLGI